MRIQNYQFDYDTRQSDAPVGAIMAVYDFDGASPIDTNYWAYCDGSTISDPESPLNGLTLPDMSNRYLVGFGTEGGGDIGTASWATAAVGNADHEIDVEHSHGEGSLSALIADNGSGKIQYLAATTPSYQPDAAVSATSIGYNVGAVTDGVDVQGSTDNSLSTGQTIQPRSIRVRWVMRIK